MNKILVLTLAGLVSVGGGAVALAQTTVDGSVINQADIQKSLNMSIGKNSKARMGSIALKNANVGKTGSVINEATVDKSLNMAIGEGASASMGSVELE